ncbi:hypothetical protein [Flavobacterium sp. U410]|jgi:PBP1b-binding outer membrane lipoprotein LpoB
MKKVVLSLALVAMMFVSCKETATEAPVEETVETPVEETVEAVEATVDTTAVDTAAVEAPATEAPAAH